MSREWNAPSRPGVFPRLIRTVRVVAVAFAAALSAGCSTYESAVGTLIPEAPAPRIPQIDLTNARWQKLSPAQPDSNPVRVAIVARDEKIGATRVVIKAPPNFTLPTYWLSARGTYQVLKGTFVFESLDADGKPGKLTQGPGAFALLSPNLIQRAETLGGDEGLLYITVYGDWAPSFAEGAFAQPTLRAGY